MTVQSKEPPTPTTTTALVNKPAPLKAAAGNHSLAGLLSHLQKQTKVAETTELVRPNASAAIEPHKRFASRIRLPRGRPSWALGNAQNAMMANDPAIRRYLYDLGSRRNNNGIVPHESIQFTYQSVKQFLAYIDVPVSDHAISDLVNYKRQNPLSDDIELALADYSRVPPIKYHAGSANRILGVFGASGKRARLDVRINNHFTPSAENCAIETFREIYSHLTPYQQDMVQWGVYVPERAKAASRTPFADIDLSRSDYAVVHMHGSAPSALGIRTKARVDHPAFVPIDFARKLVTRAQAAGRRCPFPDHQSEWKKITTFARKEYSVLLQSKYCRKFFEDMAEETSLPPSIAAFIMGDKTKLAQTGHLPQHYNLKIRFIENMISRYKLSGLDSLLWLGRPQQTSLTEIDKLREENARFKAALRQKEEP